MRPDFVSLPAYNACTWRFLPMSVHTHVLFSLTLYSRTLASARSLQRRLAVLTRFIDATFNYYMGSYITCSTLFQLTVQENVVLVPSSKPIVTCCPNIELS